MYLHFFSHIKWTDGTWNTVRQHAPPTRTHSNGSRLRRAGGPSSGNESATRPPTASGGYARPRAQPARHRSSPTRGYPSGVGRHGPRPPSVCKPRRDRLATPAWTCRGRAVGRPAHGRAGIRVRQVASAGDRTAPDRDLIPAPRIHDFLWVDCTSVPCEIEAARATIHAG